MNNTDFNNLKIIKHLNEIQSDFCGNISSIYKLCEKLLGEIPKLFSNYTMHDINHSIRVINYMTDFLTRPLSEYSELHLAAIVYVGLLHDIGMFVSDDEIEEIKNKLKLSNQKYDSKTGISNSEIQDYIRINHGKRVKKSLEYKLDNSSLLKSQLYVNSYDISDIIVNVCRSHTESCKWIEAHITGERRIASYSINPTHLAVLLRLGDALDIDDRRAPLSLYYALSPKGLSDSEWKKHIPVANYDKVTCDNGVFCITFEGECDNPEIYMALKHYIEDLTYNVLQINRILQHQNPLYKFVVNSDVFNKINAIGFSPKEVTFKLQYKQIKKLLMGEHLYGGRENGLREIIQNSIDAIRLMQEINSKRPLVSYEPTIEIFLNKESNELIIADNGIGMSESVLDEFFFNIGNSYYNSNKFKEMGYKYNAIGKFGIGFLACFMLSSEVSVITKHYDSKNTIRIDLNNNSDLIITRYMDSFPANSGTQVVLKYDEVIDDVFHNEENLVNYIRKLLIVQKYKLIIRTSNSEINLENDFLKNFSHNISGEKMDIYYNNGSFFEIIENHKSFTDYPCYFVFRSNDMGFDQNNRFFTIDHAHEVFTEMEQYIALNYETLTYNDLTSLFSNESFIISYDFQDFLLSHSYDIYNYYCLHENLVGYFDDYLISISKKNSEIIWSTIPYFKNIGTYIRFLKDVHCGNDYQEMLKAHNANYISVFSASDINKELKLSILNDHFELSDYDVYYDYWDNYDLDVIVNKVAVLEKNNKYISIEKGYSFKQNDVKCDVYVKGILVPNINIVLPFVPSGFAQKKICINIISDEYDITVARDDLTDKSKIKFINDFIKEFLFGYINSDTHLSSAEKQLLELFINEYYPL